MGRLLDSDDGSLHLQMSLIVVCRQIGGGSSLGLMALLCSRSESFLTLLVECLIIYPLIPLVSATLPLF